MTSDWHEFTAKEHQRDLLREAKSRRLTRGLREAAYRREQPRSRQNDPGAGEIKVRWSRPEDVPPIAQLYELNGMPSRAAFGEQFLLAERGGEVLATLQYRLATKRLELGLLATHPWAEERPLARALYAEAHVLARDLGVKEVRARLAPHGDYPYEVGYHRWAGGWHLNAALPLELRVELPESGWRRAVALWEVLRPPLVRITRR